MTPTQQEIIEQLGAAFDRAVEICGREFVAKSLMERFGAGGGEPVAWLNPYGGVVQVRATGHEKEHFTIPLYTHSSPTDLRAEYLRGLEDAAKKIERWETDEEYVQILADHVRALKGKQ